MDPEITPIVETPVVPAEPVVDVTPPTPVVPLTRREKIAEVMATKTAAPAIPLPRPRDPSGKFAPNAPTFPTPAVQRPDMPKSLKQDLIPHWNAAPVELVNAVHQRELDHEKGVAQLKQKAQEADELLNEFKPYEWILRNEGATPKTAISSLLQTAAILRTGTPQQKAQSVAAVMHQFGIPVAHIQQIMGGAPGSPPVDPQYNALSAEVAQLKQSLTERQQRDRQDSESRALAAIQQFAKDPEHVHFEAVQDRMLAFLQAPQVLGVDTANMNDQEKLKLAYDMAIRLDPTLSAQVLAAQQAKDKAKQVTQAKAAAVQVKGAPASGPGPVINPKDRRAIIANAFNRAG